MKTFDRDELLEALEFSRNWDTVRNWIHDMVVIEPKVMKKVSEARFGDLSSWIEQGSGNVSVCGCLVGTTAIELTKDRNHFKADPELEAFVCTRPIGDWVTLAEDEAAMDRGNSGAILSGTGAIGIWSISCIASRSTTERFSAPEFATTSVKGSTIAMDKGRFPTRIGGKNVWLSREKTSI